MTDQLQETGADPTQKTQKRNKRRDGNQDSDDCLLDLPEWLEEFTDKLEDAEVPAPAHISQDSDSEGPTKVTSKSRKHGVYIHFPKDRNCEMCKRTKITRALCRRRTAEALLRAEKFGALNIETIDDARSWHKILPLNGLNRIRARQKNFSGDRQEFKKVPRAVGKTESYSYRQFIGIWKSCQRLSWNHRTSTPHRSGTNGIAERAVRRVKEGTSAVLLQSGLDEKW